MSTFHLEVALDGAAFEDPGLELARVLTHVASRAQEGRTAGTVLDYNGNACGTYWVEADEDSTPDCTHPDLVTVGHEAACRHCGYYGPVPA